MLMNNHLIDWGLSGLSQKDKENRQMEQMEEAELKVQGYDERRDQP